MAVFSGFYQSPGSSPSGNAHGIVPPHRDGHQNGHQSGYILHRCFVCCRPGGCRGNTERVVAQWWHPVAPSEALDVLYWAMRPALYRHIRMAIKIASNLPSFLSSPILFLPTTVAKYHSNN